jgi:hypothetical protein
MTDFDPSDHTVPEVLEHVEKNPEQAEAIAAAEAEGDARKTLLEALPDPEPQPKTKSKRKARTGTYVLEAGDSPAVVARNLLGRGSLAREIVAANPGVKWRSGVEITLPTVD